MSETSPIGLISPTDDTIEGSCGLTVPNTFLKIADVNSGEALGANQRGEIWLKGPQVNISWIIWNSLKSSDYYVAWAGELYPDLFGYGTGQ